MNAEKQHKHGPGLAVKFALLASFVGVVFCIITIATSYKSTFIFLKDAAGHDQKKMAELTSSAIGKYVDEKIALLAEQTYKPKADVVKDAVPDKSASVSRGPAGYESSFGDMFLEETSGEWVFPVNIAVVDKAGKTIDTIKTTLGINAFFGPIRDFRIGDTGHSALVDSRTYLVYAPGAKPFNNKFSSYNELQKAFNQRSGWFVMDGVYGHQGQVFAGFCVLDYQPLLKRGVNWWVFVVRDAREVFAPLKELVKLEIIIGIILILALALIGFMLGRRLVRPVDKLSYGIERLEKGDFNYRVDTKGDDELGQLSASFNAMADSLSESTTSKINLNKEAEMRRKAEEKVRQLVQEWQKAFDSIKAAASMSQPAGSGNINELIKNTDKLMDASKIETDKIVLNLKLIDMRELIKTAVFKFEPKIREKGLDLKLDMPKGAMHVNADSERINQVLAIIINNAIRFTDKGYVAISIRESSDDIIFSVLDTGAPIAPEDMNKIFGDLHNLNLSIARGIIEKHGGKIWVERDPNKLTKITFSIPKVK